MECANQQCIVLFMFLSLVQEMAALVKKRGEGHVKIVRDLRRRTQLLLEKQLGQQKALIIRLEGNFIIP